MANVCGLKIRGTSAKCKHRPEESLTGLRFPGISNQINAVIANWPPCDCCYRQTPIDLGIDCISARAGDEGQSKR